MKKLLIICLYFVLIVFTQQVYSQNKIIINATQLKSQVPNLKQVGSINLSLAGNVELPIKKLRLTLNTGDLAKYSTTNVWTATLSFTIKYYKDNANVYPITESATIQISNTNPEAIYIADFDATMNSISPLPSTLSKIEIIRNSISFNNCPTGLNNDIQLIAQWEDYFKYKLGSNSIGTAPQVTTSFRTEAVTESGNTKLSRVKLSWNWGVDFYYPEFDLQIIKLDPDINGNVTLNWDNAAIIEGVGNSYELTLSEGTGYYYWRVRPVSNYYTGGRANFSNFGVWQNSLDAATQYYSVIKTGNVVNSVTPIKGNELNPSPALTYSPVLNSTYFYYNQFDENKNFSYGRIFSEKGKYSEKITYANGLGQAQQVQTRINTLGKVVTMQTVYDYLGRPSLQTLPAPTNHSILGYQSDFLNPDGSTSSYSANNFDQNTTLFNPDKASSASGVGKYYSNNNTAANASDPNNYVPSADGYPFIRTQYHKDPLNRVFRQSQPGEVKRLKPGASSKNVTTNYSSVSQLELNRIFGNEAPNDTTVFKTITTDANGVSSAVYTAYSGEILATCLISTLQENNPDAAIVNIGNELTLWDEINLNKGSLAVGDSSISSSKSTTFLETTSVDILYEITPANFSSNMPANGNCADICKTCDYHIEIDIVSKSDPLLKGSNFKISFDADYTIFTNPVNACSTEVVKWGQNRFKNLIYTEPNISGTSFVSTPGTSEIQYVTLPAGSYLISKKISLNYNSYKTAQTELLQQINNNTSTTTNCCGPLDDDAEIAFDNCSGPAFCQSNGLIDINHGDWNTFLTSFTEDIYKEHTLNINFGGATRDLFYNTTTQNVESGKESVTGNTLYRQYLQTNLLGQYYWNKAIVGIDSTNSTLIKNNLKIQLASLLTELNQTSNPSSTNRIGCTNLYDCYNIIISRFNNNISQMEISEVVPEAIYNSDGTAKIQTSNSKTTEAPTYDADFDILKNFLDCAGYSRGLEATFYSNFKKISTNLEADPDAKIIHKRNDIYFDYRAEYTESSQKNTIYKFPNGISDNMGISWKGMIDIPSDVNYLVINANDGAKVWIDGANVINEKSEYYNTSSVTSCTGSSTSACLIDTYFAPYFCRSYKIPVTPGKHLINIQVFNLSSNFKFQLQWNKSNKIETVPFHNLYPVKELCNQYSKVVLYSNRNNLVDYPTSLGLNADISTLYIHFADNGANQTELSDKVLGTKKSCVLSYLNVNKDVFDADASGYGIYSLHAKNTPTEPETTSLFNPNLVKTFQEALYNVCVCSSNISTDNIATVTPANNTASLIDNTCLDNCNNKSISFETNLDIITANENKRLKDIEDASTFNSNNYPNASSYVNKTYKELFNQDKCCVIDMLVEQCQNMCANTNIKSIDNKRIIEEASSQANITPYSITIDGQVFNYPSYTAFTQSNEFYKLIASDKEKFKLALTGHVTLKPKKTASDLYTTGAELLEIQPIIVDKIYQGLNLGFTDRKATSTSNPDQYEAVSSFPFLINATPNNGSVLNISGSIKTTVSWAPANKTNRPKDIFISAKIEILDKNNTVLDFYKFTALRPYYFNSVGLSTPISIANIYFDNRGVLHIEPLSAVDISTITLGNGNAIVTNKYIAKRNITVNSSANVGKILNMITSSTYGTQSILNPITLASNASTSQLCSLLVDGINKYDPQIKFDASVASDDLTKAIIYATQDSYDEDITTLNIKADGDLVSNFTISNWITPVSLSNLLINSTDTYSGVCPYGYTPLSSNSQSPCYTSSGALEADKYILDGNGNKTLVGNKFILTTDQLNNWSQFAKIWSKNTINISNPLHLKYKVNFGNKNTNGADGLAFFIQNANGLSFSLENAGGMLGSFQPINPTNFKGLFIEFDTYVNGVEGSWDPNQTPPRFVYQDYGQINKNDNFNFYDYPKGINLCNSVANPQNSSEYLYASDKLCETDANGNQTCNYCRDIDYDHISVWNSSIGAFVNGSGFDSNHPSIPIIADVTMPYGAKNMEDGQEHLVEIKWSGAPDNRFQLWVDNTQRLNFVSDISAIAGQDQLFFGWSAGSYLSNTQTVTPIDITTSTPTCDICVLWQQTNPQIINQGLAQLPIIKPIQLTCQERKEAYKTYRRTLALEACKQKLIDSLQLHYLKQCLSKVNDKFKIRFGQNYHNYTLYYYDRAGNLQKTVPPSGVHKLLNLGDNGALQTQLDDFKSGKINTSPVLPIHTNITTYQYNSLKQLQAVTTPDGGTKRIWYNKIGQPVISQDARQAELSLYTYTRYDNLGRIIEVAQIKNFVPIFLDDYKQNIAQLFEVNTSTIDPLPEFDYPRLDQVITQYSTPATNLPAYLTQTNLRNRISYTTRMQQGGNITTYYSYDDHGNVNWMANQITALDLKTIHYTYDLVSNKVTQVQYQKYNPEDRFLHRYTYDEDNRIIKTETSTDSILWTSDANYKYYDHGPLARTEIGHYKLQGVDNIYTIEGYLKSINSVNYLLKTDPGQDYQDTQFNGFCEDVFASELHYYNGDYARNTNNIGSTTNNNTQSQFYQMYAPLYNGNIASWATYTRGASTLSSTSYDASIRAFRYDKLNRIKFSNFAYQPTANPVRYYTTTGNYEQMQYYPDGNLKYLQRANGAGTMVDVFSYNYSQPTAGIYPNPYLNLQLNNSKLTSVSDAVPNANATDDIDNQAANNYSYDPSGNLSKDNSKLESYTWNMDGKLATVSQSQGAYGTTIKYIYDAMGQRIKKIVGVGSAQGIFTTNTYYIRDAQGNIMAIYENQGVAKNVKAYLVEIPIYGSSRIGSYKPNKTINNNGASNITLQNFETPNTQAPVVISYMPTSVVNNPYPITNTSSKVLTFTRDWWANYVSFDIQNYSMDAYSSFSVDISTQATQNQEVYLYLTNKSAAADIWWGMEDNNSQSVIAIYKATLTPTGNNWATLNFNNPTLYNTNTLSFADAKYMILYLAPSTSFATAAKPIWIDNLRQTKTTNIQVRKYTRTNQLRQYELTDHLGNIRALIADYRKATIVSNAITSNDVPLLSFTDYYAFGSNMRSYNQTESRMGFNGKELNSEIAGAGNNYDFGARMLDTRLGRWMSLDPLQSKYPSMSPYNFSGDSPICFKDNDGKTIFIFYDTGKLNENGKPIYSQYRYGSEMEVPDNKFVIETISALNQMKAVDVVVTDLTDNDPSPSHILNKLATDNTVTVNIIESVDGNYHKRTKDDKTIVGFSPYKGRMLETFRHNKTYNTALAPPSSGLSHELTHAFHDLFFHEQYLKDRNDKSTVNSDNLNLKSFPNREEYVTSKLDNNFLKYYGYGYRSSYSFTEYSVSSSTSVEAVVPPLNNGIEIKLNLNDSKYVWK